MPGFDIGLVILMTFTNVVHGVKRITIFPKVGKRLAESNLSLFNAIQLGKIGRRGSSDDRRHIE